MVGVPLVIMRHSCIFVYDYYINYVTIDLQQIFRVKHIVPPLPVSQSMVGTATQTSSQQDVAPPAAWVITYSGTCLSGWLPELASHLHIAVSVGEVLKLLPIPTIH